MLSQQRAERLDQALPFPLRTYAKVTHPFAEYPEMQNPRIITSVGHVTNSMEKLDGSRYVLFSRAQRQAISARGQVEINNLCTKVVEILQKFTLGVRGRKLEDEHNHGRLNNRHHCSDSLHKGLLELGEREEEGSVNMSLIWGTPKKGDTDEVLISFTLVRKNVNRFLMQWDWPLNVQHRIHNLRSRANRSVNEILKDSGWLPNTRTEVCQLTTTALKIPICRVNMEDLRENIAEMVMKMLQRLDMIMVRSGSRLDWNVISGRRECKLNKAGGFEAMQVVSSDFTGQLKYKSRHEFFELVCQTLYNGEEWYRDLEIRRMQEFTNMLICSFGAYSTPFEKSSYGHAIRGRVYFGEHEEDVHVAGFGFSNFKIHKTQLEDAEDLGCPYLFNRIAVQNRCERQGMHVFDRNWFSRMKMCITEADGLKVATRRAVHHKKGVNHVDDLDVYWMLKDYKEVHAEGETLEETCGMFSKLTHGAWWGDSDQSNFSIPLELFTVTVIRLRIVMEEDVLRVRPWQRVHCDILFSTFVQLERCLPTVIAHLNAAAMMRKLENDIFDHPRKLGFMKFLVSGPAEERRMKPLDFQWRKEAPLGMITSPIDYRVVMEASLLKKRQREVLERENLDARLKRQHRGAVSEEEKAWIRMKLTRFAEERTEADRSEAAAATEEDDASVILLDSLYGSPEAHEMVTTYDILTQAGEVEEDEELEDIISSAPNMMPSSISQVSTLDPFDI